MLTTYTAYLRGPGYAPNAFEPLMCDSGSELMRRVREILDRHPDCETVDVYLGDTELFQVRQPPRPAS